MENPGAVSNPTAPGPDRSGVHRRRGPAAWAGLVVLALAVIATGTVVAVIGPLLAIACDSCQDGVRSPLRFGGALIAIAQYVVPLMTLGTAAGTFLPRGGARVGGIGLAVLVVLLIVIVSLGQYTA